MDSNLQRLHSEITRATRGLTPQQLTQHLEGKWCCAEILEHLYYTYTGTIKAMELCLESGPPTAKTVTLRDRVRSFLVTGIGYFPEGRQAPERTRPRGMSVENVVNQIAPKIVEMDSVIQRCEDRYGKRALVLDHPILGPFTCSQWRKFHWVHGRHHLRQIERLCSSQPAMPGNK